MIDTKELRRLLEEDGKNNIDLGEIHELLDRLETAETAWKISDQTVYDLTEKVIPNIQEKLEAAEKERDNANAAAACVALQALELEAKLEAAEKDVAIKEEVIDALGSELNAVANGRDALRTVLADLLDDLEERAKWNLEESQRVVACGNGVYMRAKAALDSRQGAAVWGDKHAQRSADPLDALARKT